MKDVDEHAVIADVVPLQARLDYLVVFHRALGDGTRMRIVWTLMDGFV